MHTPTGLSRSVALLIASPLTALLSAQGPAAPAAPAAETPVPLYAPKAPESATLKDSFKGIFYIGAALNPGQFTGRNAQGAALVELCASSSAKVVRWFDGLVR